MPQFTFPDMPQYGTFPCRGFSPRKWNGWDEPILSLGDAVEFCERTAELWDDTPYRVDISDVFRCPNGLYLWALTDDTGYRQQCDGDGTMPLYGLCVAAVK